MKYLFVTYIYPHLFWDSNIILSDKGLPPKQLTRLSILKLWFHLMCLFLIIKSFHIHFDNAFQFIKVSEKHLAKWPPGNCYHSQNIVIGTSHKCYHKWITKSTDTQELNKDETKPCKLQCDHTCLSHLILSLINLLLKISKIISWTFLYCSS